jgi:hypothetical protein
MIVEGAVNTDNQVIGCAEEVNHSNIIIRVACVSECTAMRETSSLKSLEDLGDSRFELGFQFQAFLVDRFVSENSIIPIGITSID